MINPQLDDIFSLKRELWKHFSSDTALDGNKPVQLQLDA